MKKNSHEIAVAKIQSTILSLSNVLRHLESLPVAKEQIQNMIEDLNEILNVIHNMSERNEK